jgi:predicted Holliday junction resolvase-like endonuclease
MQEIDLFECFHNHPAKPRKEIDRKESSQAKQINERQSKRKKEMKEKEAWRTKEIRKEFVGPT